MAWVGGVEAGDHAEGGVCLLGQGNGCKIPLI